MTNNDNALVVLVACVLKRKVTGGTSVSARTVPTFLSKYGTHSTGDRNKLEQSHDVEQSI